MKKKSGAARRLVSLMLALGLIFTLTPVRAFAGDEVPAGNAVVSAAEEEPAVDGDEPAVEGNEPAVEGNEPAVEGNEPAVEGDETAVEGDETVKKAAPVVMSAGPSLLGSEEITLKIAGSDLPVYAVEKRSATDQGSWIDSGEPVTEVSRWMATDNDQVYFLVSVPDHQAINVSYYENGTYEPNGKVQKIRNGNIPLADEALAKGMTHYFVFSGPNYDDIDITVSFVQADAYFYLHRYDVPAQAVAAADFYYIGKGKVDLAAPTKGDSVTEDIDSHIAAKPEQFNAIVLNNEVEKIYPGLMTYTYSESETPGTYSVAQWEIIKGESGANKAYPTQEELVASEVPTWHVDGKVSLNKPSADFYAQVEGDAAAVYSMGSGYVAFRAAQPNETIDLAQIVPAKAQEQYILTEPASFPEIEYKGHKYTYANQDNGAFYTYTLEGWNEAVGVPGGNVGAEWRVNGKIKLNTPPEFTDEMKPGVSGAIVTYDGNAHGLTINYRELYPARYFEVTYEVWNKATGAWDELPLGEVPEQTAAGSLRVRVTFDYLSGIDSRMPWTVEAAIVVMPRPLTLTVQDVTITTGTAPAFTVIPSAEGTDAGLLTGLGHTLADWKINEDYNDHKAGEYTITLRDHSWVIRDSAGNDVSGNYSVGPVAGKLTVQDPLPAELRPTVTGVSVTYDGRAHGLNIGYPAAPAADEYKVEYQIAGGAWSETAPSLTNAGKTENIKVRFTYDEYAAYEAPGVYAIEVTRRPITLKANDKRILDGEKIPAFSFSIAGGSLAQGHAITGVTYGGFVDKLGVYDLVITGCKIVDTNDNNADVTVNYAVDLRKGTFVIGATPAGPAPSPAPAPVPTPVPGATVTPAAPVTPDEEEEEAETPEAIEEEETPQASPNTDADKEAGMTETIEDEETARAGAPGAGSWALLNLILMVLTVGAGLGMLALRFTRNTGMTHLLGIVPAIVALVAFFVTEDMSLPMTVVDKWTLIMAFIALVQAALLLLGRNGAQDDRFREQY